MKKLHAIVFIFFCVLCAPSMTYACGKKATRHGCDRPVAQKEHTGDCCTHKKGTTHDHHGCQGKCGHSSCGCTPTHSTGITDRQPWLGYGRDVIRYSEKQSFFSSETEVSPGFNWLWLIPKIS